MTDLTDGNAPGLRLDDWIASKWSDALMRMKGYEGGGGLAGWKYTGKHDPQALGLMLATAKVHGVPASVAVELGVMLAPPRHWRGPRLKVIPPSVKQGRYLKQLSRMRAARREYLDLKASGLKHASAVSDLAEKYEVKRTWVTDAIALTDEKFVAAIINGTYRKRSR